MYTSISCLVDLHNKEADKDNSKMISSPRPPEKNQFLLHIDTIDCRNIIESKMFLNINFIYVGWNMTNQFPLCTN